jgi:PAS domain S-box-containing protein
VYKRHEYFRTLFENNPIAYQALDSGGNILQVNSAWEEMFGYAKKEVISKSFSEFILPEMRHRFKKQFPKQRSLDEILGPEFVLIKKNGDRILAAHKGKTGVDSLGNYTQTHCVLLDITSQRKAEQERQRLEDRLRQAQKMETLGTLAGGVAHDFNNILSIIIGNYEHIKEELPGWSPLNENLEQIRLASLRARDVVRQLLTFARRSDTQQQPMNIATVVHESLQLIRSTIPTNIEIQHHLPEGSGSILGNSTQINQLIINLCTNAADAMLPQGGRLTIGVEKVSMDEDGALLTRSLKPGPHIKLVIEDAGRGIDAQTLAHIFEPYFTTKPFGKGTGIGLAVVHGIVDHHKGEIFVESKPGRGTTFTILFPEFQDKVEEKRACTISFPKGNERILLVDDETSIVRITQSRLTALGYSVTCTTDPRKALDKVKADPSAFDLVITDMAMPHMTGDALSSKLLSLRPDLPIILCTGFSEVMNEEKARKIGITGFLIKPVELADFAVTVRKTLDKCKKVENVF